MNDYPKFAEDDENDTLLFNRWEEHVLNNCPNPERIGCPDYETLKTFVETPRKVGLTELHGDHIVRCSECTRELIELRRLREERLKQDARVPQAHSWWGWKPAVAAVSLCVMLVVATVIWRNQESKSKGAAPEDGIAQVTVDLSADGVVRDSEGSSVDKLISLPRALVDVHLILPYYSPAGDYRIIVAQGRNSAPVRLGQAIATAQAARTELRVRLDLRELRPGRYYLGTKHDGEATTYYYPFTVG